MRYLEVAGNLDPNLLTAVGFADSRPVAGLSPKDARNRRVEIVVSKPVETPAATPAAPATPATASTTATAATPATTVSPDAADAPATEGGH
jgi:hypothetical protein